MAQAILYVHQEPQPPRGYRRGGHAAEDESVDDKKEVSIVFDYVTTNPIVTVQMSK